MRALAITRTITEELTHDEPEHVADPLAAKFDNVWSTQLQYSCGAPIATLLLAKDKQTLVGFTQVHRKQDELKFIGQWFKYGWTQHKAHTSQLRYVFVEQ
jgi:hypothetical protein